MSQTWLTQSCRLPGTSRVCWGGPSRNRQTAKLESGAAELWPSRSQSHRLTVTVWPYYGGHDYCGSVLDSESFGVRFCSDQFEETLRRPPALSPTPLLWALPVQTSEQVLLHLQRSSVIMAVYRKLRVSRGHSQKRVQLITVTKQSWKMSIA